MGVNISSPNHDIAMGYGGFARLRRTIAGLCPNEIKLHYEYLLKNLWHLSFDKEESDRYDRQTEELYVKYGKKYGKVLDFLYAPDTDGKLSYGTCKQLLDVIGDYDDDSIYGYAGWGEHAARFRDFKEILEDCYKSKKPLIWD
ncbi:MAG: hypothetical protein IJI66_01920 [Erysipelotrichaceae bacterium]|nr:hypothetical protein [Erysipelotrichaceae bacterium]